MTAGSPPSPQLHTGAKERGDPAVAPPSDKGQRAGGGALPAGLPEELSSKFVPKEARGGLSSLSPWAAGGQRVPKWPLATGAAGAGRW